MGTYRATGTGLPPPPALCPPAECSSPLRISQGIGTRHGTLLVPFIGRILLCTHSYNLRNLVPPILRATEDFP